jgi:hypothetical protein
MVFPIVPTTSAQIALFVIFAGLSWLAAKLFFFFQKHILIRVDRSLVA